MEPRARPYCHKVKAGLEAKGIPYQKVDVNPMNKKELPPGLPEDAPKKVPVVKFPDGEVVFDSTAQAFLPMIVSPVQLERANGLLFAAEIVAGSIAWLFYLVVSQSHGVKDKDHKIKPTGHKWDEDLEELNTPLPRWWLQLFIITNIFGLVYLFLYPGSGLFGGLLGWTSADYRNTGVTGQYETEMADAGISDQTFEIGLSKRDECSIDDSDDRQPQQRRRHGGGAAQPGHQLLARGLHH